MVRLVWSLGAPVDVRAVAIVMAVAGIVHAAASRPNVLLITVDDLRPEIGVFHPWSPNDTIITPHLDGLAANGTLFVSGTRHASAISRREYSAIRSLFIVP